MLEGGTGTSSLTFTVSLSAASGLPAAVDFASADGTALAGTDYTAVIGTLNFAQRDAKDDHVNVCEIRASKITKTSGSRCRRGGRAIGPDRNPPSSMRYRTSDR